jgi:hypothetical protein
MNLGTNQMPDSLNSTSTTIAPPSFSMAERRRALGSSRNTVSMRMSHDDTPVGGRLGTPTPAVTTTNSSRSHFDLPSWKSSTGTQELSNNSSQIPSNVGRVTNSPLIHSVKPSSVAFEVDLNAPTSGSSSPPIPTHAKPSGSVAFNVDFNSKSNNESTQKKGSCSFEIDMGSNTITGSSTTTAKPATRARLPSGTQARLEQRRLEREAKLKEAREKQAKSSSTLGFLGSAITSAVTSLWSKKKEEPLAASSTTTSKTIPGRSTTGRVSLKERMAAANNGTTPAATTTTTRRTTPTSTSSSSTTSRPSMLGRFSRLSASGASTTTTASPVKPLTDTTTSTSSWSRSLFVYGVVLMSFVLGGSGMLHAAKHVHESYEYHRALMSRIESFEKSIASSHGAVKKLEENYLVWNEYVRVLAEEDEQNSIAHLEQIQLEVEKWQTEMKEDLYKFRNTLSDEIIRSTTSFNTTGTAM